MIHPFLTIATVALYGAAFAVLVLRLLRRLPAEGTPRAAALALTVAAIAVHAVGLWDTTWQVNGLNLRLLNAASLITWLMAALLTLATARWRVENLGVIVLPVAMLVVAAQSIFGTAIAVSAPRFAGIDIHILLSVAAYSVLGIATAQSLLLAVQEHQLRHRHPGGFLRLLPPLQSMDGLLFTMLRAGFVLLTASLISGWVFVEDLFAQDLVHKTVLTMFAWALFAALLLGRWHYGWRGQTAARFTVGAFVVLGVGYFGSKFVLEVVLGA